MKLSEALAPARSGALANEKLYERQQR